MKSPYQMSISNRRGMTLLEITVVILVLLSLMGALFVGANAWTRGSDRSMSILLIRNSQQGLRSHLNVEGAVDEASYPDLAENVFGAGKYVPNGVDSAGNPKAAGELPDHPRSKLAFGFALGDSDLIPQYGELYMCTGGISSLNDYSFNPKPSDYAHW